MLKSAKFAVLLGIAMTTAGVSAANAAYFVRPTAQFSEGELIDGYIGNGATYNSVSYYDAARAIESSVDLETGKLKSYAASAFVGDSAWGNAIMGETITIRNGAGTTWNFELALDGWFDVTTGPAAEGAGTGSVYYDLAVAVYRPGVTDYNHWFYPPEFYPDHEIGSQAVYFEYIRNSFQITNDDENPFFDIYELISGSIALDSDYEQFDFYAKIFIGGTNNVGGGMESFVADFSHTGSIGLSFEDGVDAYSDSGKFLGLRQDPNQPVNQVPLPGAFGLMLLGLLGGAAMRGRNKA